MNTIVLTSSFHSAFAAGAIISAVATALAVVGIKIARTGKLPPRIRLKKILSFCSFSRKQI